MKDRSNLIYAQYFFRHGPEVLMWWSLLCEVWEGIDWTKEDRVGA